MDGGNESDIQLCFFLVFFLDFCFVIITVLTHCHCHLLTTRNTPFCGPFVCGCRFCVFVLLFRFVFLCLFYVTVFFVFIFWFFCMFFVYFYC